MSSTFGAIQKTKALMYNEYESSITIIDLMKFQVQQKITIDPIFQLDSINFLVEDQILVGTGHSDIDLNVLMTIKLDNSGAATVI